MMPTTGTTRQDFKLQLSNIPFGTSPLTVTIPQSGSLANSIAAGYVHFKISAGGSVSTVTVTGTDGTNTELLVDTIANAALSPTSAINMMFPFLSDLNLTGFNLQVTGTAGGYIDVEIAGTTGAF